MEGLPRFSALDSAKASRIAANLRVHSRVLVEKRCGSEAFRSAPERVDRLWYNACLRRAKRAAGTPVADPHPGPNRTAHRGPRMREREKDEPPVDYRACQWRENREVRKPFDTNDSEFCMN